jgi:exopolyphosphatase/guanosine-5'-triphosphate,3'-diphosphate pyrophosphatase
MQDSKQVETVAAVDLGSNSFHMKIAMIRGQQLAVVDRMREMVQLAAGLDDNDHIGPDAVARAIDCLHRFGQRLRGIAPEQVRAVGTNTLRRARNAGEIIDAAEAALGHRIEIIAGREEARLIYSAVAHERAHDAEQLLVVDIGGGSTEFIIGRRFTPILTESLYMGCVGLTKAHFPQGRISESSMERAELAALQELEPIQDPYVNVGWQNAIGSSGTMHAVERILRARAWSDEGITRCGLERLRNLIVHADHVDDLAKLDDLAEEKPERLRVLPGGVAILRALFEAFDIDQMVTSSAALREGLLFDLLGRSEHHDVRDTSIRALQSRYHIDLQQAGAVEQTAMLLRAQLAPSWKLRRERYDNLLSWACKLHELGLDIAHAQYHKHGGYVIENADMAGFSRDEQMQIAALVRGHRRKFPLRVFEQFRGTAADRLVCLTVILRLAVVLHRSRTHQMAPLRSAVVDGRTVTLTFPPGWLEGHPLTLADLNQEANYLQAAGFALDVA